MANRPVQAAEVQALNPEHFPVLDLIQPEMQLRPDEKGGFVVLDLIRRKWLQLTPEEWVRQHVVHWLQQQSGFPASLLSLERGLPGKQKGRTDVLGFDRQGRPLLLVECKSAKVEIAESTVIQALAYNASLKARFIWLSNGLKHKILELHPDYSLKSEPAMLPRFEEMERMAG